MVTDLRARVPTFKGKRNQVKVKVLFLFYRYKSLFPSGAGLTSHDLAYLMDATVLQACDALRRLAKWNYILSGITPRRMGVNRQHIYRLSSKGEQYLIRWNHLIPWDDYGWTAETIEKIDRDINQVVQLRGYQ